MKGIGPMKNATFFLDTPQTVFHPIGRPSNFGSGEEKSLEKASQCGRGKMQKYIISAFPDLRKPLEWAAMTAVPITHQLVEQRLGSEADPTDQVMDLEDKMHQVFAVLMQVM